jgi:hypothetical protein
MVEDEEPAKEPFPRSLSLVRSCRDVGEDPKHEAAPSRDGREVRHHKRKDHKRTLPDRGEEHRYQELGQDVGRVVDEDVEAFPLEGVDVVRGKDERGVSKRSMKTRPSLPPGNPCGRREGWGGRVLQGGPWRGQAASRCRLDLNRARMRGLTDELTN